MGRTDGAQTQIGSGPTASCRVRAQKPVRRSGNIRDPPPPKNPSRYKPLPPPAPSFPLSRSASSIESNCPARHPRRPAAPLGFARPPVAVGPCSVRKVVFLSPRARLDLSCFTLSVPFGRLSVCPVRARPRRGAAHPRRATACGTSWVSSVCAGDRVWCGVMLRALGGFRV